MSLLRQTKFNVVIFSLILISSCNTFTGEEIARLPINQVSTVNHEVTREITIDLKKDDEIIFWSDMDMEFEGQVSLRFRVKILKGDKEYTSLEIDPTDKNITLGEIKTSVMDKHKWRFRGRNTKIKVKEDGTYTFISQLIAEDNPTLKINKAELVIKK